MYDIFHFPHRTVLIPIFQQDNLVNQRVLQKQLKNYGFTVAVANHGGECLDQLRESRFWHENQQNPTRKKEPAFNLSVVLMDQEMPVMDGMKCTKTIREWEKDGLLVSHVPVIGVTANARVEQIQALLLAGMVSLCLMFCLQATILKLMNRMMSCPNHFVFRKLCPR
jgi:CheY-like chemotaxis protein